MGRLFDPRTLRREQGDPRLGLLDPTIGLPLGSRRVAGAGGRATSPNAYPQSRSAGRPIFPHGTGVTVVDQALPVPPPMPHPAPAGPYEQETSKGKYRMVQSFCDIVAVTSASIQILPGNEARKGLRIANPSATLTIFLNFNGQPATIRHSALFPLNTAEFWVGNEEYIPKDAIFAIASAAGPVSLSVTEFS